MRRGLPTAAVVLVMLAAACAPVAQQTAPPAAETTTTTASASPTPPAAASLSNADITLTQVANISSAITMAVRPNDPAIYVGTQNGFVWKWLKGRLSIVFDFSTLVLNTGEQGLLGMTFNAAGTKLYIHYSSAGEPSVGTAAGATEVDEFGFTSGDFGNRRRVLTWPQPQPNHNGGSLVLGPTDNMLYLALGDGGGANDGWGGGTTYDPGHSPSGDKGNAQSFNTILGKIVRFDPTDPTPGVDDTNPPIQDYTVPADNPFVGGGTTDDVVWSLGLRNPFRISFDKTTGDLWVGDVGQGLREEIDFVANTGPTARGKAVNFAWNRKEGELTGPDTVNAPLPPFTNEVSPVLRPSHSGTPGSSPANLDPQPGDCAVIGGYVYRGTRIPDLAGAYVYTDYCDEMIRAFMPNGTSLPTQLFALDPGVSNPASFGQDNNGELYVLSLTTGLWRIDPAVPPIRRG